MRPHVESAWRYRKLLRLIAEALPRPAVATDRPGDIARHIEQHALLCKVDRDPVKDPQMSQSLPW